MLEKLKSRILRFFSSKTFFDRKMMPFIKKKIFIVSVIITLSYLLASVVSSLILPLMISLPSYTTGNVVRIKSERLSHLNYRELKKTVLARNIFNETGEYPKESDEDEDSKKKETFSLRGPCPTSKLRLKLIGVLYASETGKSIASIKEEAYNSSDTYIKDQMIYGMDNVEVVAILPDTVILNNNGRKECLYTSKDAAKEGEKGLSFRSLKKTATIAKDMPNTSSVLLQSSWVKAELGDNFGKITRTGNIVPNLVDGNIEGYILTNPHSGSLFDRIGLKAMDVITRVNNDELTKDNGSVLYEYFKNKSEITIHVQRGAQKKIITVQIK